MTANGGAWGIAMWKDGHDFPPQEEGISLSGGDAIDAYLPTTPVGCLTAPPIGMGVPPVRNGDVVFAQRDGVVQFADYYEPRQITLQVSVCNEGCPGCDPEATAETFLLLNGVSPGRARTLDRPSIKITGDIDLRIHAALDDWTPASAQSLLSKSMTSGNLISWRFTVLSTGILRFGWSANGSTVLTADSTVAPTVTNGSALWVRVTMDVDNGAAGRTITFHTSTDGETWTILGAPVVQAGVTSIYDPAGTTTASINVGARDAGTLDRMAGKVYSAEVYRGIDGTLVADPDFTEEDVGTTIFDDSVGNVWEVFAPAVISSTPGAVPLTGRQKVKRLTKEWSRNCTGATLVIFSDCHNPAASGEDQEAIGPYIIHGRPRVAEVNWLRSDIGCAEVTLRFDAEDARLLLAVDNADPWTSEVCVTAVANDGPVFATVTGDLCVYPVFTLAADLTDPITVTYGDWEFIYNEPITGAADPVVVDTRWGIATQGNVEVTKNLSGEYSSPLEPGTHDVEVTTGNGADDGTVTMCWSNAVVSG